MLNRPANAESQIQLWRNCLSRRSDLAIHGEPTGITNWTRRGEVAAERVGQLLGDLDVFLLLDSAAHGHDDLRLRQVDRLLGFFENFLRLVADDAFSNFNAHGFNRSRTRSGLRFIAAVGAILK